MTTSSRYLSGAIGGLVGGIVYGIILTYMGRLAMYSDLIGSESTSMAWALLLVLSVAVGVVYAWWFGSMADNTGMAVGYGLLHGLIWWALGALIIMPLVLGSSIQITNALSRDNLTHLASMLVYGVVLGFTYGALYLNQMETRRSRANMYHRSA